MSTVFLSPAESAIVTDFIKVIKDSSMHLKNPKLFVTFDTNGSVSFQYISGELVIIRENTDSTTESFTSSVTIPLSHVSTGKIVSYTPCFYMDGSFEVTINLSNNQTHTFTQEPSSVTSGAMKAPTSSFPMVEVSDKNLKIFHNLLPVAGDKKTSPILRCLLVRQENNGGFMAYASNNYSVAREKVDLPILQIFEPLMIPVNMVRYGTKRKNVLFIGDKLVRLDTPQGTIYHSSLEQTLTHINLPAYEKLFNPTKAPTYHRDIIPSTANIMIHSLVETMIRLDESGKLAEQKTTKNSADVYELDFEHGTLNGEAINHSVFHCHDVPRVRLSKRRVLEMLKVAQNFNVDSIRLTVHNANGVILVDFASMYKIDYSSAQMATMPIRTTTK